RAKPHVAEQGDHGAGADADAIDGGDDRLRAGAHRLHQIAGHAREGEQSLHVAPEQRADDIVHVTAGAEIAGIGAEHHRLDVGGIRQPAESVAQLGVGVEGDRVLALRPVKGDHGHVAVHAPVEMLRLEVFHDRTPPLLMRAGRPSRCRMMTSASSPSISARISSIQSWCALAIAANRALPFGVSRTMMARRSSADGTRATSPSLTSRSMMPVTLPFETSSMRDSSVIVMPFSRR